VLRVASGEESDVGKLKGFGSNVSQVMILPLLQKMGNFVDTVAVLC
jgi:hypothetical protein